LRFLSIIRWVGKINLLSFVGYQSFVRAAGCVRATFSGPVSYCGDAFWYRLERDGSEGMEFFLCGFNLNLKLAAIC